MPTMVRYGALPNLFTPGVLVDFYGNPIGNSGAASVSVLDFGADPTGTFESTAAFNEALAALPTSADFNIPVQNPIGTDITVPYGLVTGGGRFIVNQTELLNHFGPFVMFDGLGFTFLDDYNSTSNPSINMLDEHGFPGSATPPIQPGPQLQYWTGGIRNTVIDGTNVTGTGNAINASSGEYCRVDHCQIQNYPNNTGLYVVSNGTGWMESWHFDLQTINCLNAVVFGGVTVGPHAGQENSQGQGRMWLRISAYPGQNGVVCQKGAWVYHAQIYVTGVMYQGTEPASANHGAALTVQDANTQIEHSRLDFRLEMDQIGVNTWQPQSLFIDSANGSLINQCDGYLGFKSFGSGQWKNAHPLVGLGLNSFFQFYGPSFGDSTLTNSGVYQVLAGNATGT